MICPRCGYEYSEQLERCPICRHETPRPAAAPHASSTARFCPQCGAPASGAFCQRCGTRIPPVQPPHTAGPGFVPPASNAAYGPRPTQMPNGRPHFTTMPGMHPMTAAYQRSLREHPQHQKLSGWMKALIVFCIILYLFSFVGGIFTWKQAQAQLEEQLNNNSYWTEDPFADGTDPDAGWPYSNGDGFYGDTAYNPGGCSSEELQKIKTGMDYAQISAIIGGDAQGEDYSLETNDNQFAAVWVGETNPYLTVTILFEEGKATSISADNTGLF